MIIGNLFSDNKRNNLIPPLALTNMALQESLIRHQNFKCKASLIIFNPHLPSQLTSMLLFFFFLINDYIDF